MELMYTPFCKSFYRWRVFLQRQANMAAVQHTQSGQVGVIVLLIMVVLLTVGLSVASRSTQDLFLTQQQVDSTRVFNAAEAGIDQALSSSFAFNEEPISGEIADFNGSNIDVAYQVNGINQLETRLFEMLSVKVDVTGNANNGIIIEWSRQNDCGSENVASVLASVYFDDAGTSRVRHYPIQGCDRSDNFLAASDINNDGYRRRYVLPLTSDDQFVRIKPLYNDTNIRVQGDGWTLPVQYYNVRSEATNTNGTETRIVEVNRTLNAAPSIFDYAVVSETTLVK
jgi:Tfp pilus assembly protein PilX